MYVLGLGVIIPLTTRGTCTCIYIITVTDNIEMINIVGMTKLILTALQPNHSVITMKILVTVRL